MDENVKPLFEGALEMDTDETLHESVLFVLRTRIFYDRLFAALFSLFAVAAVVYGVVNGFDARKIVPVLVFSAIVIVWTVWDLIKNIPKSVQHIIKAIKERQNNDSRRYAFYTDRYVITSTGGNAITRRFADIDKMVELKYSWVLFFGGYEKDFDCIDKNSLLHNGHLDQVLALMCADLPEKSIKHRK